jgi:hypothetical protein
MGEILGLFTGIDSPFRWIGEIKWVKPGVFILSKNRLKLMLVIRPVFVPLRLVVREPCV